jgi:hypothetical protein
LLKFLLIFFILSLPTSRPRPGLGVIVFAILPDKLGNWAPLDSLQFGRLHGYLFLLELFFLPLLRGSPFTKRSTRSMLCQ